LGFITVYKQPENTQVNCYY